MSDFFNQQESAFNSAVGKYTSGKNTVAQSMLAGRESIAEAKQQGAMGLASASASLLQSKAGSFAPQAMAVMGNHLGIDMATKPSFAAIQKGLQKGSSLAKQGADYLKPDTAAADPVADPAATATATADPAATATATADPAASTAATAVSTADPAATAGSTAADSLFGGLSTGPPRSFTGSQAYDQIGPANRPQTLDPAADPPPDPVADVPATPFRTQLQTDPMSRTGPTGTDLPNPEGDIPHGGLGGLDDVSDLAGDATKSLVDTAADAMSSAVTEATSVGASLLEGAGVAMGAVGGVMGAVAPFVGPLTALVGMGFGIADAIEDSEDSAKADEDYSKANQAIAKGQATVTQMSTQIGADQFSSMVGAAVPKFGSLAAPSFSTAMTGGSSHF